MSTWKIVLWLVLFFPLGVYYMWRYSNWNKKLKYGISGIYGLILFSFIFNRQLALLVIFGGLGLLYYGISTFKENSRNKKITYFLSAFALIIFGATLIPTTESASPVDSQAETKIVEKPKVKSAISDTSSQQAEDAKKIAESNLEKEKQAKTEQAALAVKNATDAVILAESTPTRENYDKANTLVVALTNENQDLVTRLGTVKQSVETEETRVAAVKAEEIRVAAAEKAESERIAAEQAQVAETARIAEEQRVAQVAAQDAVNAAAAQQAAEEQHNHDNDTQVVFVTTYGTKYHSRSNCSGLNASKSTRETTLQAAQGSYDPCSICW
ncbi:serine protease [Carnobacterium gallinarum]|uniref:hypothetical protein n=1 Tax=Carnobacterium gallinarum TaxID=2749 RepID=UPI00068976EE|nr:hypothetical protein [Carnobacterium gallinarum]